MRLWEFGNARCRSMALAFACIVIEAFGQHMRLRSGHWVEPPSQSPCDLQPDSTVPSASAQSSLPPSMVQMGWEYPVPPPPSNALMGLMGDGPFAAGAGQPAGFPLPGCADCLARLRAEHRRQTPACVFVTLRSPFAARCTASAGSEGLLAWKPHIRC